MTNKLQQIIDLLNQAEIKLKIQLNENCDGYLANLIELQIQDIVDAQNKLKGFQKNKEVNLNTIEESREQPKEIEVLNRKRTAFEYLQDECENTTVTKKIQYEEQNSEKDIYQPKQVFLKKIEDKKSYVPLEAPLPEGFEFFKDDYTSMNQLKWTSSFEFSHQTSKGNRNSQIFKGREAHLFMDKYIKFQGDGMEEYLEQRCGNQFSLIEKQMLLQIGKQTLQYLKLRNFENMESEKYFNPYRIDVLATNDEEALIIDWKNSSLTSKEMIILDHELHFLKHIEKIKQLVNKKTTLMIISLQKFPIEFIEYTAEDIEEIQKDQYKYEIFQNTFKNKIKDDLNNREEVMKRSFTDCSGKTQTIGDFFGEIKNFFEGKSTNINLIEEFLDLDNAKNFLLNQSQNGETPQQDQARNKNLENFFILNYMIVEHQQFVLRQDN